MLSEKGLNFVSVIWEVWEELITQKGMISTKVKGGTRRGVMRGETGLLCRGPPKVHKIFLDSIP